jgi:AsmA protein
VAALAAWLGTPLGDRVAVGAASISGRLSWVAANLNFLEAQIDIDGNVGEGALTATLVDGRPGIQGTLDFARFDFAPIVSAVRATLDEGGVWRSAPVDLPIVRAADLDLRLSAYEAVAGGMPVGPLAATVLAKGGELMVEVGEAHLGSGFLEASLQARMADGVLATDASLKGEDVAAETVLGLLGINGITGTGEVSARVVGAGTTWDELISGLAGTLNLDLAAGVLSGIDVASIPAAVTGDATSAPLQGATSFDRMDANLTIASGLMATDDFSLTGAGYALDLAGKLALAGPTIEARGVLSLAGDPPRDVPFLVNGPWASPSFQPDLGAPLQRPEDAVPGDG